MTFLDLGKETKSTGEPANWQTSPSKTDLGFSAPLQSGICIEVGSPVCSLGNGEQVKIEQVKPLVVQVCTLHIGGNLGQDLVASKKKGITVIPGASMSVGMSPN
jgi:hypothetical protein